MPAKSTGVIGVGLVKTTPGTVEKDVTVVEDIEVVVGVTTNVSHLLDNS